VSGSGGLTAANALAPLGGTLTLNGPNTYTGLTTINGMLKLGNSSALGSVAGGTVVSNGGTLDLAGQAVGAEVITSIQGTGVGGAGAIINSSFAAASLSGNIALTGDTTVGSGNITLSGAVTSSYSMTKIGSGTLTLSGTTDNVGLMAIVNSGTLVLAKTSSSSPTHVHAIGGYGLIVNGGTAQLGGTGNDQIWDDGSNVTVTSGTFDTNGQNETMHALYLQGTGIFGAGALVNTQTVSVITPLSGTVLTGNTTIGTPSLSSFLQLNNTISGNFAITKVGDGALYLPGTNTFSGGLFIQSGQLQIATINNAGTNGPLGNNTSVTLGSNGQTATLAYSGASASSNMSFILPTAATGVFLVSGSGVNLTLNGTISGGGTLRVPVGTITLGASNAFTGGLLIANGEVRIANPGALNSSAPNAVTFTDSIGPTSTGKLTLQGNNVTVSGLSTNGSGSSVQDVVENGGTALATLTVDNATDNTFAGILRYGTGALSIIKTGAGTLTLSGTSDNVGVAAIVNAGKLVLAKTSSSFPNDVHAIGGGGLTVSGGTAQLAGTGNDQIWDSASVTVTSGTFDMNGRNESIVALNLQGTGVSGAGALVNSAAGASSISASGTILTGNTTIGVTQSSGSLTLNNGISGNFTITKVGAGTLTLTGANTYSGDTIIEGGTLSIQQPYLHDIADVRLSSGAKFDLNFVGTDIIDSLFIDELSRAPGTYGAIGSNADFKMDLFTGTGLLQVSTFVGLAGDYNNDDSVDAADYVLWRKSPNTFGGDPAGYNTWRSNFGQTAGSGSSATSSVSVPEPSTFAILMIELAVLLFALL
jgi:fibronectin-binding autotransporter adhesin